MREPPIYVYIVSSPVTRWLEVFGTRKAAREWVREATNFDPGLDKLQVKRAKLTILG